MSVQGPNVAAMGATGGTQLSFADLAHAQGAAWTPADEMSLRETTFVVVDLETTGGRTTGNDATPPDAITEIGAVKVCGGAVLGEFATLVNPQHSIPPQIVRLTGITTAMVGNAPTIDAVLPMFFEFAPATRCSWPTTLGSISDSCAPPRGGAISPGPNHRCCARCGWPGGC